MMAPAKPHAYALTAVWPSRGLGHRAHLSTSNSRNSGARQSRFNHREFFISGIPAYPSRWASLLKKTSAVQFGSPKLFPPGAALWHRG